jgi:hypothetical protein
MGIHYRLDHILGYYDVEKCHYYPNLWSKNTLEYYCTRKFVIVQHRWSASGLRFRKWNILVMANI